MTAFVAKVNSAGTALLYTDYIGGSNGDYGVAIALDWAGDAYVTGNTSSTQANFPVTVGPDLTLKDMYTTFVAKITESGLPPSEVSVTITSAPDPGLSFTVSGAGCRPGTYKSPLTFKWMTNATCLVDWISPQGPGPDVRYTFAHWSDNSTVNPATFVAPAVDSTLSATFEKAWRLTVKASPEAGGSVLPLSGFFDDGSTVAISAAANPGYTFTGWTGFGGGSFTGAPANASVTLNRNGPITETATFEPLGGLAGLGSIGQIASAGTWKMALNFLNLGTTSGQARMNFFGNDGSPLTLPLTFPQSPETGTVTASTIDRTIDPGAQFMLESTGPDSQPVSQGWGQLLGSSAITGFGIFSNPAMKWEAVVPLESRNATKYILAFDNTNGLATGVAIANLAADAANVPVIIRDDTGAQIGKPTIVLAARGHTSFMLNDEVIW